MVKQAEGVYEAKEAVDQMTDNIHQIEQASSGVSALAREATLTSESGMESVHSIAQQMTVISGAVDGAQRMINELSERTDEIGNIVSVINDIATQTNMLSINASIEAARAGEYGRGFAVVAKEVKRLAHQSATYAKNVNERIGMIQSGVSQAVVSMNTGSEQVEQGLVITRHLQDSFQHIGKAVGDVYSKTEDVNKAIQQVLSSNRKIVEVTVVVSSVSETGLKVSNQASEASQQQHETTEGIANSAHSLASLAEELQLSLQRFIL